MCHRRPVRIFVTGATGLVGENVARDLAARGHEIIAATRATFTLEAPSIPDAVDGVVHCAAITSVAACEADPVRAVALNVHATAWLAREAAQRRIPLVFTSTDLVFDGSRAPYAEDAEPCPPTHYGRTKVDAERAVLDTDERHSVLRLALVVGARRGQPGGFLEWLVRGLRERTPTPLYVNQRRTPLFVGDVAPIAEAALAGRLRGTHHLASGESLSREAIGRAVARAFDLDDEAIVATVLEREARFAPIDDCALDTRKLRALGFAFTPLDRALTQIASP
jgi:dTDP-4-dehydrorhamnose reductase